MEVQSLSANDAALIAAREIVKHLEGAELFETPCEIWDGEHEQTTILDYDDLVALIEEIIAYHFSLDSHGETDLSTSAI